MTALRDHTFLGMTQSLCPDCLALVPAKIITKGKRVYFRKRCPTHGVREDFICSDVGLYDQMQYSLPGKIPPQYGVEPDKRLPVRLRPLHRARAAHLRRAGRDHLLLQPALPDVLRLQRAGRETPRASTNASGAIDRLVAVEGRAEVLQLSGGEPTIHPDFLRVLDYAAAQADRHRDDQHQRHPAGARRRSCSTASRGIGTGSRSTSSSTGSATGLDGAARRAAGRDEAQGDRGPGPARDQDDAGVHAPAGRQRPRDRRDRASSESSGPGSPASASSRRPTRAGTSLPEDLERRITFPDVIQAVAEQTDGLFREDDFLPLPCAHPNCHSLTYAFRSGGPRRPPARGSSTRGTISKSWPTASSSPGTGRGS